jgi:hypothetical protein
MCVKTNSGVTGEKSQTSTLKQERNKEAAANDANIDADIRAKEERTRQTKSNANNSGSGNSRVNRG